MIFMPSFQSSHASFSVELTCSASSNLNHILNNPDKKISLTDQILIVICLAFLYKILYLIFSWSSEHSCTIFFSLDAFCVDWSWCCSYPVTPSLSLAFFSLSNLFTKAILMYSLSVKFVWVLVKIPVMTYWHYLWVECSKYGVCIHIEHYKNTGSRDLHIGNLNWWIIICIITIYYGNCCDHTSNL